MYLYCQFCSENSTDIYIGFPHCYKLNSYLRLLTTDKIWKANLVMVVTWNGRRLLCHVVQFRWSQSCPWGWRCSLAAGWSYIDSAASPQLQSSYCFVVIHRFEIQPAKCHSTNLLYQWLLVNVGLFYYASDYK